MRFVVDAFVKLLQERGRTSLAVRQIAFIFGLRGLGIFVSFLYVPLLLNYLSPEKYGIWLALASLINWFAFLDIGLGLGLKNKLAEALATGDSIRAKKLVATTYGILLAILVVFLAVFHTLNLHIDWQGVLQVTSVSGHELYLLTSIVFSAFVLNLVLQTIAVIYQAMQEPFVGTIAMLGGQVVSFGCIYFLTQTGDSGSLVLMGTVVSMSPVVSHLLLTFYSFSSKLKFLRPSAKHFDKRCIKEVTSLGASFFAIQISSSIIFASTSFFILRLFNSEEVVRYNIAFKYFTIPIMLNSIFLTPVWASVTDAYIKRDYGWLKATIKKLNVLSILFVFAIVFMIIVSDRTYRLWVGEAIAVPGHLTVLMGVYAIINVVLSPYSHFLNGFGKVKISSMLSWIWVLVFVGVMLIASKAIGDSSAVALALSVTTFLGSLMHWIQVRMLIGEKALGIWNR